MNIKFDFKQDKLLVQKIYDAIEKGLTVGTILVRNKAVNNCPVGLTGNLRGSIDREVKDNQGIVYTNVEYAPYVEFGTKWFKGRYFMRRALFEDWQGTQKAINDTIKKELN